MYYRSGTSGRFSIGARQTLRVHLPDGSTFLCEMSSCPPPWYYDVISEIRFRQSIRIDFKNNPAKFHPGLIWNDGALSVFDEVTGRHPNKKNKKNKMSSDMRSVPGLKDKSRHDDISERVTYGKQSRCANRRWGERAVLIAASSRISHDVIVVFIYTAASAINISPSSKIILNGIVASVDENYQHMYLFTVITTCYKYIIHAHYIMCLI